MKWFLYRLKAPLSITLALSLALSPLSVVETSLVFAESDLRISDIQGNSHYSPYEGSYIKGIRGVVTAVVPDKGFYLQGVGEDADKDPETSDAIYVFGSESANQVEVGNYISVNGTVAEYTAAKPENSLSGTQLIEPRVKVIADRAKYQPKAVVIGKNGRQIPQNVIDNDQMKHYDPDEDALDFYESLENMLVTVNSPLVVGSYQSSRLSISVLSDNGMLSKDKLTQMGGIKLCDYSENPEILQIGDMLYPNGNHRAPMTGDWYTDNISGLMVYDYGKYQLMNTNRLPWFEVNKDRKPEVTDIDPQSDKLTVASYNIENFSAETDDKRTYGIAKSIVHNLKTPDIIGLVEIQDADGENNSGNVEGHNSYLKLMSAIRDVTNNTYKYKYAQIDPNNNQDGGAPGSNIRVGFLYNPDRVKLAEAPHGDADESVRFNKGHLTLNPGRILPEDESIFSSTRKPLAAEFIFKGESYFLIANHFSSKKGSSPLFGSLQPSIDPGKDNRIQQAKTVNLFVEKILSKSPDANIIALGDFNDFEFSDVAKTLEGSTLYNLHNLLPQNERYTYQFNGSSQVLDHILVSKSMRSRCEFDAIHINAFFTEDEGRVSDHDPVLMQYAPR